MEEQIEAVQRMQDYIETHLQEEITLANLSKESHYSPWYSYRIFTQWMNMTPADYVRKLRLSKSALKLRDEEVKIIEVAFEVGFQSVDGYQRAFYREFGCNPRDYAKNPVPLYLFQPYGIKYSAIRKEKTMAEVKSIFVHVVEKPARKVMLRRGQKAEDYFAYCEEVGCDVWGLLMSMKSISGEPVCLWLPERYITEGTSKYVQGVELPLDYDGCIPEGFDMIELPACKYLMFQGQPFAEEEFEQAINEVWKAIETFDPEVRGFLWDKENPRIQLEPRGQRGYIELLPVIEKI